MCKHAFFELPRSLNLVFLVCLTGSILFALVQVRGQQDKLSASINSPQPGIQQVIIRQYYIQNS